MDRRRPLFAHNAPIRFHVGLLMVALACGVSGLQAQTAPKAATYTPAASGFTLETLAKQIAQHATQNAGQKIAFIEHKFLKIVEGPVESSGELEFAPPQRLVKRTTSPLKETMTLDGDTMLLERGSVKRSVKVDEQPQLAALVQGLRALIAGDQAGLQQQFDSKLSGAASKWALVMTPKDAVAKKWLIALDVEGNAGRVFRITLKLADGDSSVMTLKH